MERGREAVDCAEAFAPGASVYAVARRWDVVPGQIYRWRNDLRSACPGFAAVVVTPEPNERSAAGAPAVEIELGRDIRVRIAPMAPADLVSAIIKALAAR